MKSEVVVLVLVVVACCAVVHGKTFTRCELVRELKAHGVTDQLGDWTCLAENESSLRSHKVGGPNRNGSYDYGIFQINSRYWCGINSVAGDCNIKCDDLKNDDISDDITCAKKVFRRHGFRAWYAWRNKCDGKPLPDVSSC